MAPIKKALNRDFNKLHQIIIDHYDIDPGSELIVEGKMDKIYLSRVAKVLAIVLRPIEALVPYEGENVFTRLMNKLNDKSDKMYWKREFHFEKKRTVIFSSRMEYYKDHEIIEYLKFGLGGVAVLSVEYGSLVYKIKHYTLSFFGLFNIPIPAALGLGTGIIKEIPIDTETFRVEFNTTHPIFGKMFGYSGNFKIVSRSSK